MLISVVIFRTMDLSGKEGQHYIGKEGVIVFEHGECEKNIEIPIINDHATIKEENFQVVPKIFQTLNIFATTGFILVS